MLGLAAPFLNPFLQLAAEKKDSKNGAARKFFGPSYFDLTLSKVSVHTIYYK